jgi:hypothetical protein
MTVPSVISRNDYAGTGSADTFDFDFSIYKAADLEVRESAADGVETVLENVTDYTITGIGTSSGYITLTAGNLASGHTLTLRFRTVLDQQQDIRNQGSAFTEIVEAMVDRCVKIDQQQQEEIDRAIKVPVTSDTDPDDLIAELVASAANATTAASAAASSASNASTSAGTATTQASISTAQAAAAAASAAVAAAYRGPSSVQVFTSSGTYTPPLGLIEAQIMVKGGGSSGASSTSAGNGGGGGEGEECWKLATAATIGASQAVTIGAGGTSVTANTSADGVAGGTTSFGAIVTAVGGGVPSRGNFGGGGGAGGSGGSGANYKMPGARGFAGSDSTGTQAYAAYGGGKGGGAATQAGFANSGGGGGGGSTVSASGVGGSGICVVLEYK